MGFLRVSPRFYGRNLWFCEAQRAFSAHLPVKCWYSNRPGVDSAPQECVFPVEKSACMNASIQLHSRAGEASRTVFCASADNHFFSDFCE